MMRWRMGEMNVEKQSDTDPFSPLTPLALTL